MLNSCDAAPLEGESISSARRWKVIAGSAINDSAPLIFLMGMHPAAKKFLGIDLVFQRLLYFSIELCLGSALAAN